MTEQIFRAEGQTGRVVIYEGPKDPALVADPYIDLSRISFHSDLDYLGGSEVQAEIPVALSSQPSYSYNLISVKPHNMGFTPVCSAKLLDWPDGDGNPATVPLGGGTLLDFYGQRPAGGQPLDQHREGSDQWSDQWRYTSYTNLSQQRILVAGAGANATHLVFWVQQYIFQGAQAYPDTTFNVEYQVGDRSVDGVTGVPVPSSFLKSGSTGVHISTRRITTTGTDGNGFSSQRRYIRDVPGEPGDVPLFVGPAMDLSRAGQFSNGPSTEVQVMMNFGNGWAFRMSPRAYTNGAGVQPLLDLLDSNIIQAKDRAG